MRPLVSIAILSLALAAAAPALAAEKCVDKNGHAVKCPKPSDEVNVVGTPLRKTPLPPVRPNPDTSIPPMATALCRDGTFSRNGQLGAGASCALHGGVDQWTH